MTRHRRNPLHCIVPPELLKKLSEHADPAVQQAARQTLSTLLDYAGRGKYWASRSRALLVAVCAARSSMPTRLRRRTARACAAKESHQWPGTLLSTRHTMASAPHTSSTRIFSNGIRSITKGCASMPSCIMRTSSITRSGPARKWSSAMATVRPSSVSRKPSTSSVTSCPRSDRIHVQSRLSFPVGRPE